MLQNILQKKTEFYRNYIMNENEYKLWEKFTVFEE